MNKTKIKGEYAQTISFTAFKDDIRKLKKLQKKFKNRSEALRFLINREEVNEN